MTSPYATTDQLAALCERAKSTGRIALDTEFLRERRYFAALALVQVRVEDEHVLVDPLSDVSLEPLEALLSDESVVKVLHAAQQDLEIFVQRTGAPPARIFDTQIAASIVGLGAQASLLSLVETLLGQRLKKGESFTDWLRRPLSKAQVKYALDDVRYLFELHDKLGELLEEKGRRAWAEEECAQYEQLERFMPSTSSLYRQVRGSHHLHGVDLAVLRELSAWREEEARKRDRPRRTIVSDETLVQLSRSKPNHSGGLRGTRGLNPKEADRSAAMILDAIACGQAVEESSWPEPVTLGIAREDQATVRVLDAALACLADERAFEPAVVAPPAVLAALARRARLSEDVPSPLAGWRQELVGDELDAVLRGERSLRFDAATGKPVLEPRA